MARAQSVVLSASDKKAVITDIKTQIKHALAAVKANTARINQADRTNDVVNRTHAKLIMSLDRSHIGLIKTALKLQASLIAMTPVKPIIQTAPIRNTKSANIVASQRKTVVLAGAHA